MQPNKHLSLTSVAFVVCLLAISCNNHKPKSPQTDSSLTQSQTSDTQDSIEYEKRFRTWIIDTLKNLKAGVIKLSPQAGVRTRDIFVRDDSSELILTDRYKLRYIPQDTFDQSTGDAFILSTLKQYKEEPSEGSEVQFVDEIRYTRSYYPSSRCDFIQDMDSIFVLDKEKRTKKEYSYIRGRYSRKTVTYLNSKPPRVDYYEFLWPGDTLTKRLVRTTPLSK
ncbi:hypothetical protein CLV42_12610 [Chitinophaga ginsengisoli]|uniref:Uncharacterized protein n=1 Tax=Chitinophaga ginsengisoli TaxID=363837 RepID=A0A2P8FE14_9BACT|nr:hypothetical protein CLV42_12610 [Chitinophaga ginsengisoli]